MQNKVCLAFGQPFSPASGKEEEEEALSDGVRHRGKISALKSKSSSSS